jgi:hypothetical protein
VFRILFEGLKLRVEFNDNPDPEEELVTGANINECEVFAVAEFINELYELVANPAVSPYPD